MSNLATGRLRHFQEIVVVPVWRLGAYLVLEVVGTALTWRDLLVSKADQAKWRLDVLPHWAWGWWALGTCSVLLATLFEHSYRLRRKIEGERDDARGHASGLMERQAVAQEDTARELKRTNDMNAAQRETETPEESSVAAPFKTLHDYFKSDFPHMMMFGTIRMTYIGAPVVVESQLHYDFAINARFSSFYVPHSEITVAVIRELALNYEKNISGLRDIQAVQTSPGDTIPTSTVEIPSTGRVFVYHEDRLSHREVADLLDLFQERGLALLLRGPEWLTVRVVSGT